MKLATLPGISIAVGEDGKVVWTNSFGVSNIDTREPVRDDTMFEAASMSKAVFAYIVLQLVDQGRLHLDSPLAGYFKPDYLPDDPNISRITARHVLTHTSGLPDWGVQGKRDTFRPMFTPGRFFSYSRGRVLLVATGDRAPHSAKSGRDQLARSCSEPAGMALASSTYVGDAGHAGRIAYGHLRGRLAPQQGWRDVIESASRYAQKWNKAVRDWRQQDWVNFVAEIREEPPPPPRVRFSNAAASLQCTPSDYTQFLALLCERSHRAAWEIPETTRREMVSPQVAVQEGAPLWWGLGVAVERDADGWRVGHEGNNDNRFTSYSGANPTRRYALVIMTNGFGFEVYQRIVRSTTGLDQLSFVTNYQPPRAV